MFSSNSVPEPSPKPATSPASASPDYAELVRFLVEPFLDSPDALRVDCEKSASKPRVWIRLAFEGEEKGRVFGRGGRNIQAIRTVLEASARAAGDSLYLDIYGSQSGGRESAPPSRSPAGKPSKPPSRPSSSPSRTSARPRYRGPG